MILSFGKYQNKTLKSIYDTDRQYLKWLATQPWFTIKYKEIYEGYLSLSEMEKVEDKDQNDKLVIYTDGACSFNGDKLRSRGGIGVHFSENNKEEYDDISCKLDIENPTNNKAELLAILECLKKTKETKLSTIIYTDSQYSINAIVLWYPEWLKNDKLEKKKNIDILKEISEEIKDRDVDLKYIRGHTNKQDIHSKGNERADYLATSCL